MLKILREYIATPRFNIDNGKIHKLRRRSVSSYEIDSDYIIVKFSGFFRTTDIY